MPGRCALAKASLLARAESIPDWQVVSANRSWNASQGACRPDVTSGVNVTPNATPDGWIASTSSAAPSEVRWQAYTIVLNEEAPLGTRADPLKSYVDLAGAAVRKAMLEAVHDQLVDQQPDCGGLNHSNRQFVHLQHHLDGCGRNQMGFHQMRCE